MRVRINIPAWGRREIAAGAAALAARGAARRARLARALAPVAPGWTLVPVASARFAIALAVRALGLTGRRVAVPAYVCPAVLTGLGAAPAEAVPVDCAPSSLAYDAEALARAARSGEIDAVLAPNTYGVDQDFAALGAIGLPVVEDAAYQTGRAGCGTRADAGVWSFNFKALTSVGGGVLLVRGAGPEVPGSSRPRLGEALRFVNYAVRSAARHRIPSFLPGAEPPVVARPSRARAALTELREAPMSELQAAVALVQWERRDRLSAAQRENAAALARVAAAADGVRSLAGDGGPAVHLFPFLLRSRAAVDAARRSLHERGVQTEDPYPLLWDRPERFANASDLADRLLLVPCNASLRAGEMRAVAAALADALAEGGGS